MDKQNLILMADCDPRVSGDPYLVLKVSSLILSPLLYGFIHRLI